STEFQLWRLENVLAPAATHQGYDRLYLPRIGHTTGNLDIRDLAVESSGQVIFAATRVNCLGRVHPVDDFAPVWRPAWVTQLIAEDRCHLTGLAVADGKAHYVSVASATDTAGSWRSQRRDGGRVLEVPSGQTVAQDLSLPVAPRWHRGRLWVLEAGRG